MKNNKSKTNILPESYARKYKSSALKARIADDGMWQLIPAVNYDMNSPRGIGRLEQNDILFQFIDRYFPNDAYAFEPNMMDGRFAFLPDNVRHQGIALLASTKRRGFLEVAQFWYPYEFTDSSVTLTIGLSQVSIPQFDVKPTAELAAWIRKIYMVDDRKMGHYCTFPFTMNSVITLQGDFMDKPDQTAKIIRQSLKKETPLVQRNGEGLIQFMRHCRKH